MISTDPELYRIVLSDKIFISGDETTHFQKLALGHEEMQAENVFLQSYRQCTRKLRINSHSAAQEFHFNFSLVQFSPPHDRILLLALFKGLQL